MVGQVGTENMLDYQSFGSQSNGITAEPWSSCCQWEWVHGLPPKSWTSSSVVALQHLGEVFMGLVCLGVTYLGGRIGHTNQLLLLDPLPRGVQQPPWGTYAFHACPSSRPTFAFFFSKTDWSP